MQKCGCVLCVWINAVMFNSAHKFDFRFVANETTNKWRSVERRTFGHKDLSFRQNLYAFF